ncbi:hypothetical protein NDU88_003512 [Pleurodeles waltl]|uniref:Myb/SANT-like DNA-binding domain-containing protein n=1 Tax=Pleurodeles waltl TaxID=8319 RepID=A0AAV7VG81_PLEWA|nr:hypothetical protein NDU88_003512 [Pleurodeles waltl]
MELWPRVVDRVNAMGQHPRTRDEIRKRWNDLRGKEEEAGDGRVAAVDPVDSEYEEAEDEDNRTAVI